MLEPTKHQKKFFPRRNPRWSVVAEAGGNLLRTYLGQVAGHHTVVNRVKQQQNAHVHPENSEWNISFQADINNKSPVILPDVWFCPEEEVEPHERCHHDHVADDADEIADLVDEEEPFVH